MQSYAGTEDYQALFPDEETDEAALMEASEIADKLTFGRITAAGGLSRLTEFQRECIVEAVCRQAKFLSGNRLNQSWNIAAYSINGVSVKAGHGENVRFYGGVAVPAEAAMLLDATGLTVRLAGEAV